MVSLTTDKQMMFGGTEEPCAYGELISSERADDGLCQNAWMMSDGCAAALGLRCCTVVYAAPSC